MAATAPAAAVTERRSGADGQQPLSVCADLDAAMAKDASLARTVQRLRVEFTSQKATKADVLASLDRTGALERHPGLAIETLGDATEGATDRSPMAAEPEAAIAGLSIRVAWGPGKVTWHLSNPQASPYYYSYKPESATALKWASAPEDDLDALYKRSWSACNALKVPDSATITVHSNGTLSKCENAAMAALGHVVRWVNTCSGPESSFPDDGL